MRAPLLCRGGSRSLTFPAVHPAETPTREPPSTRDGESEMDEYESLNHTQWECLYHVYSSPSAVARRCIEGYGSTWARCYGAWPRSRRGGSEGGRREEERRGGN